MVAKIKCCKNCSKAKKMIINQDFLCKYKGVVSPDYVCFFHEPAVNSHNLSYKKFKCIECENFLLKNDGSESNASFGLCSMFSVRSFDGKKKNACSKFLKKQQLEVS